LGTITCNPDEQWSRTFVVDYYPGKPVNQSVNIVHTLNSWVYFEFVRTSDRKSRLCAACCDHFLRDGSELFQSMRSRINTEISDPWFRDRR
jgi:hypothetical protein